MRNPDRGGRPDDVRRIQRPGADEDEMRADLGLAEQMHPAQLAEPSVHPVAAVRHADEVARLPGNGEAIRRKADADRRVAGRDVLAQPAPAQPGGYRLGLRVVADRAAKTAA